MVRNIKMTNIGPLLVEYKWKFLLEKDNIIYHSNTQQQQQQQQVNVIPNRHNSIMTSTSTRNEENLTNRSYNGFRNSQLVNESNEDYDNQQVHTETNGEHNSKNEMITDSVSSIIINDLPNIEEIFDISPLYGSLHPGESQSLTVTYYGHKEISAHVKAVCQIKDGPDYELLLKGEASVLSYAISDHIIDLGFVSFDDPSEAYLTIRNLGKVGLDFTVLNLDEEESFDYIVKPQIPMIIPPKVI
jgi:hypothetical protein